MMMNNSTITLKEPVIITHKFIPIKRTFNLHTCAPFVTAAEDHMVPTHHNNIIFAIHVT